MALRRSTKKLSLSRKSRRKRGGGISLSIPFYDLEYRQMTENYRDGIISFDEYIAFLKEKEIGIIDKHDRFTIEKRIKDITNAYNKKLESEYKEKASLEYSQITEDYRDGLIGYSVYSEYLSQRLETLDSESLEYFTTQKKLDDITEQHIDKQIDFGFKVAKTIEPDDYIRFKKEQLDLTDPNSNKYLEIQKDIENAQWEKVRRTELKIKFDVNQQTTNKMDLAKFYADTAQGTDDPEKQMLYYNRYVSTIDSINKKAKSDWDKQRALEDRDMTLKHRRGDLGETGEENDQVLYDHWAGRLETEPDINKQYTYISRTDALVKSAQDRAEQEAKLGEKMAKEAQADKEKKVKEEYDKNHDDFYRELDTLDKRFNTGEINVETWAQEKYKVVMSYEQDLEGFYNNPNISESTADKIFNEHEGMIKTQETDAFYKAFIPKDDGTVFKNPNYKIIAGDDPAGNPKTTIKYDPSKSYEMRNEDGKLTHIFDKEAGVYRELHEKTIKDESGKDVTTRGIYKFDKDGNPYEEIEDATTGQWGRQSEEGFVPSTGKIFEADIGAMVRNKDFDNIQQYQEKVREDVWKEAVEKEKSIFGKVGMGMYKWSMEHPESVVSKTLEFEADVGKRLKPIFDIVTKTSPLEFVKEKAMGVPDPIDWLKGKLKIGDKGEEVLAQQRKLADAGVLNKKFITGFFGPKTAQAQTQAQDQQRQIQAEQRGTGFEQFRKDIGTVGKAIGAGAKKYFQPKQDLIGGALGAVYAKRPDLQKVFDTSGKGKGWNIQDWAKRHGWEEEATLAGEFGPRKKFTASKFDISKWVPDWKKSPLISTAKKFTGYTKKAYSSSSYGRLSSDIKTVGKAAVSKISGWRDEAKKYLGKLKFW